MSAKTALVCDDDATMARVMTMVLKQRGFTVLEATDGEAGLSMIQAERPALVMLDLQMPKMDGIELLTALKAAGHTGSYIIVLSADKLPSIEAKIAGLGAGEAMVKPFNPLALSKRIEALVTSGAI